MSVEGLPMLPEKLAALVEAPSMRGTDLLAQASRIVVVRHVAQIYAYHHAVALSDDVHAVHQMRVATRRTRAVLAATGEAFKPKVLEPITKRLRRIAGRLGVVRDADVFLKHLHSFAADLSAEEQAAFAPLIRQVEQERAAGQVAARAALANKRYGRLLDSLTDFLAAPLQLIIAPDGGRPVLVRHRAGSAIWQRYEEVRRYETVLPTASDEQLHDLRIACKHLRYTIEMFEAALGQKVGVLLKPVALAQEYLGVIHDADVALAYVEAFAIKHPAPILEQYMTARRTERAAVLAGIPGLWVTLTGETVRRAAGRALAEL